MYGKIFESMYEGSLYGQWEAIVTMQQFIVIANQDGVVDMTTRAIAAKTSIPIEIIEKGIEQLSAPDEESRTQGHDGVRIELIDQHRRWGWIIVNYQKYMKIVRSEDKRKADRERLAAKRASKANKNGDVADGRSLSRVSQVVANVAHVDVNVDTNKRHTSSGDAVGHKKVPDYVDQEVWNDFIVLRKNLKAVNSDRAINTLINKIEKYHNQGLDVNEMLEASIVSSWKDIYPRKEDQNGKGKQEKKTPEGTW